MISRTRLVIVGGLIGAYYYHKKDIYQHKIDILQTKNTILDSENRRLKRNQKNAPLTAVKYWSYVQEKIKDKDFLRTTGRTMETFIKVNSKTNDKAKKTV